MAPVNDAAAASSLYRAVWRWHFIAGLTRPSGRLGVPPAPRVAAGVLASVAVVGVIYPLVGATLVAAPRIELFMRL